MSFKDKIQDKILKWIPEPKLRVEAEMRRKANSGKIPSGSLKRSNVFFEPQSLQDWIDAVSAATAPDNATYQFLAEVYDNLLLDAQTSALIDTRIFRVVRSKFTFRNANTGEELPELKKLFERPWFEQFVRYAMMSLFTGVKVLELFELDADLELVKTTNIPMAHIVPGKNKIVYQVGSNEGYYFDKPPASRYYIQIGGYRDLGLLAELAPLILAKKLSMGSWLDFIEKFGVPPVWITTDNKTEKRLDELFEMAKNIVSNAFGVINTGEKIEVGQTPTTDTYKVFDEMIKRINSELAKRILGQDATTTNKDSKGTYGSLKIMQEVANDRHESDKLFVQYIINKKLLPLLTGISSTYAPLANVEFDWDESEELTNAEFLDRVVKLTQSGFTIDHEAVAERTGIPITGFKQTTDTPPEPTGGKKKKPLSEAVQAYYSDLPTDTDPEAIDISRYTKTILKIAKTAFKKGLKSTLSPELANLIFTDLNKAAKTGYGDKWIKFDPHHSATVKQLQKNLLFFSVGKSIEELKGLNALMVDETGKIRNWNNFKKEVLKLNKRYNLRYLQAEYQTANHSAQMARKWNEAQAVKHLYPNLEYRTAHDSHVREEHALLDGVIRPIDDPFWDTRYPPNGWRCRCSVRSTKKAPTPENKIPKVPIPKDFRHNVGKTGQIFDQKKHPYFKYIKEHKGELEWWKMKDPHYVHQFKGKGNVYASIFADNKDYTGNMQFAINVAKQHKIDLYIKPDINKDLVKSYLHKSLKPDKVVKIADAIKNNEYLLKLGNETLQGDLAIPDSKNFKSAVRNIFKNKFGYTKTGSPKQLQVYDKVFIAMELPKISQNDILQGMAAELSYRINKIESIKAVIIQIGDQSILIKRGQLLNKNELFRILNNQKTP